MQPLLQEPRRLEAGLVALAKLICLQLKQRRRPACFPFRTAEQKAVCSQALTETIFLSHGLFQASPSLGSSLHSMPQDASLAAATLWQDAGIASMAA